MKFNLKAAITSLGRNLTLTSPQLINYFGGGPTKSGERVNVDTALRLGAVWACAKLIAGTISTLPAQFYLRDANGRGAADTKHPLYSLLHDQPNFEMTAVTFWEAMIGCLMLWGNAYARITRAGTDRTSVVVALEPLKPDRVLPRRRPDGSRYFEVTTYGQMEVLEENEVMHLKGFSLDGISGLSPVGQARETMGLAMAAESASASLFRNGMRSQFAVSMKNVLNKDQRKLFDEDFLPKFTGAINAGRVPFLENGWTIENLGMNPADAQLLATRAFSIEEICRWYGVQPVMIGHMEKSTAWGTGLEQMNLWFLTYTLRPILRSIEQEVRRSLLLPEERLRYYLEFNVEGLLRADSAGRAALMKVYADSGIRTRNELRALDNMPPLPGGDDLTVMANMLPAQLLGQIARLTALKPADPAFTGTAVKPAENQGTESDA